MRGDDADRSDLNGVVGNIEAADAGLCSISRRRCTYNHRRVSTGLRGGSGGVPASACVPLTSPPGGVDGQDDGFDSGVGGGLAHVAPDQLGRGHAECVRGSDRVGALGEHAGDGDDGDTVADLVALGFVCQRSAEALFQRPRCSIFSPRMCVA